MVQTLVILPIVAAGVVFMVKNSLALAFSLGGIVAAVSFRNTLRDTKDAVYIFLATGVGSRRASSRWLRRGALHHLQRRDPPALVDRLRPPPAEPPGPIAQRRLQRARALANRTSAFVSLVDDQILESLTPDQLEALAERGAQRRDRAGSERRPHRRAEPPRSQESFTGWILPGPLVAVGARPAARPSRCSRLRPNGGSRAGAARSRAAPSGWNTGCGSRRASRPRAWTRASAPGPRPHVTGVKLN